MKIIAKKLLLIIKYFFAWLIIFESARLLFVLYNFHLFKEISIAEIAKSFFYGVALDMSITAYISAPIILFFIFSAFIKNAKFLKISLISYSIIGIILTTIIIIGDAETYCHWGFRLDSTPLEFITTPSAITGSVSIGKLFFLIFLSIFFACFSFFILWLLVFRHSKNIGQEKYYSCLYLIVLGLLFIVSRGGIGIAPVNAGVVYYSQKTLCNNTAINVVWNFCNSLIYSKIDYNKFSYFDDIEKEKAFQELTKRKTTSDTINYKFSTNADNIIFIVLESLTADAISCLGGENLMPNIDRWSKKGILFNNFYANCDRSDKALVAIFSATPSLLHNSLMKHPEKSQKLPSIIKSFSTKGFHSAFYYGGDINFANMNSYIHNIGFEKIVSKNNYKNQVAIETKWGYHDEFMFDKFYSDIEKTDGKNIFALFTLSSHEPYDVPRINRFPGDNEWNKARNSYIYLDSCLNIFLTKMEASPKWQNSLIILVSDHGTLFPGKKYVWNKEKFKALMLFLGASVEKEPFVYSSLADQSDIAKTLCEEYKINSDDFIFGNNLFANSNKYAFYSFVNGFGFLIDNSTYIYNTDEEKVFFEEGNFAKKDIYAKSYMQKLSEYYKSLEIKN